MSRHSNKRLQGKVDLRKWSGRRGTLFHYYLVYLFLSSVMLTSAGLCMHTVLKADRSDRDVSAYLKTVLQLERSLRSDAELNSPCDVESATLVFSDVESGEIRWKADRNVLRREVHRLNELHAIERFVFRKGTDITFSAKDDLIRISLIEPPQLALTSDGQPEASTARPIVEILLFSKQISMPDTSESVPAVQPLLDAPKAGAEGISPTENIEDALPGANAARSGEAS